MHKVLTATADYIDDTSPSVAMFLRHDYGENAALLPRDTSQAEPS